MEQALSALILDSDFERLEDLLAEFNLFDVLGIARREVQHSALLAWLLNPEGSHGLRDYFLRKFLSLAAAEGHERGIPVPTPIDIDGWSLDSLEVVTERHFTAGTNDHYIDVLLIDESDGFVCLIENKIGSGEHSDQLSRYLDWVEIEYEELAAFPIFLTPDGRQPEEEKDAERYVRIGYGDVCDLITRTLDARVSTISESVATFLEQYVRSLRRRVVKRADNPDDIDLLAYKLYNNHRSAIDRIIAAQSYPFNQMRRIVESAVQQHAQDLQFDSANSGNNCYRYYSKSLEDICELKSGWRWTPSKRIALFEFIFHSNGLVLYLMLGPGLEGTRKRLHKRTRNPGRKFKKDHFNIYRRPILNQQHYREFNSDKLSPEIEQAVKEFYNTDYWPLVNDIRKEFCLDPVSSSV